MDKIFKYFITLLFLLLGVVAVYFAIIISTSSSTIFSGSDFVKVDERSKIFVQYDDGVEIDFSGNQEIIDSINQLRWGSFLTGRSYEKYTGILIIDQIKFQFDASNTLNGYRATITDRSGGYWQGSSLAGILIRNQTGTNHTFPDKLSSPSDNNPLDPEGK